MDKDVAVDIASLGSRRDGNRTIMLQGKLVSFPTRCSTPAALRSIVFASVVSLLLIGNNQTALVDLEQWSARCESMVLITLLAWRTSKSIQASVALRMVLVVGETAIGGAERPSSELLVDMWNIAGTITALPSDLSLTCMSQ